MRQVDFPQNRYITNNNIRYFPDIVVKNHYYKDIYFIVSDNDTIEKISSTLYLIPNKLEYLDGYIDSSYYKQKLKYLLLTNGVGLTNKGKQYLSDTSIEFEDIYKYYLDLSIYLINVYMHTSSHEAKIELYSSIANNIFYNFYIMKKTGKLPCLVDCGYKSLLHYDYDNHNYWYRSKAENNISINKLDLIIEIIENILSNSH